MRRFSPKMENTLVTLLLLFCTLSSSSEEELQPYVSDVHTVLRDLSTKLGKYEVMMEQQKRDIQEQAAKLEKLENQVNDVETMKETLQAQATELKSIKTQTDVTTNQVETLRRDKEVGKVAFSASLLTSGHGHTGPYNAFTPLVFRHVISNIGNAYSPDTGFFIAPVRGAYHFEFYIAAYGSTHDSGARLLKNGEHVVIAYESESRGWGQSANGATLLLEANDVVSLQLWGHARIYENANRHNTFSGRLLFTMLQTAM